VSRIPIRLRLTLPFAAAMALVLAATGIFIYLRVGSSLLGSVDTSLRGQIIDAKYDAAAGHVARDRDASEGAFLTAVTRPDGSLLMATPASAAVLPARPRLKHTTLFTTPLKGLDGTWQVAESPGTYRGSPATIIVARSLAARTETLTRLSREFLLAAPAALLLAVLAGYGLAAAALRPVEAMRRRAAAVTPDVPGRRLPVPRARDEVRALALTLNDMLARLEAAFEHERRFLSDASHELRTPLALLRAELELALSRPRTHDELEAAVRSAAEETERLSHLAEDLLLIARADQGRLPVRRETTDAHTFLLRIQRRFAGRAASANRELLVNGGSGVSLDADVIRVEQALANLVDNALVHGAGAVELSALEANGHVELHVLDEGPGFPADFAERAFDRFSRADEARSNGGSGLGLAIVALVARAHDGSAAAANRPGGGLDAWIALPRSS